MAVYDSKKTRQAARTMEQQLLKLRNDVLPELILALQASAALKGVTANAMNEALEELSHSGQQVADQLETVAKQVNAYADKLEEIDDQLAKEM